MEKAREGVGRVPGGSMAAIVCHGPQEYRLEERPIPAVGPGEALLRVESVGICASDAKCFSGAPLFWGDDQRPAYCQAPVVPGHEFVGEVVAVGEGSPLHIGQRAVSEQIVPCGQCRFCRRGQYWMCQRNAIYGFRQQAQGAMAEYVLLPCGSRNYVLPPDFSAAAGALIEPLGCSIHAVDRADIHLGDVVVVAGCGPLGLGMIAAARLRGPGLLVAVDARPSRLDVAQACGADLTLDLTQVDAVAEILGRTEGYGCDVYIEASGAPAAVAQGLRMVRKLGTFVEFSVMREPVTVDWTIIGDTKELDIRGSHLSPYCYPVAIDMLRRGQFPTERVVTHSLPLAAFDEGMGLVLSGDRSIKVQLRP
jgi:threonine dehydrogenase-like Zn-dependent dehydrogenase